MDGGPLPRAKRTFLPNDYRSGPEYGWKGATQACQVWPMEVPTELYHTNWLDRTISWLDSLSDEDNCPVDEFPTLIILGISPLLRCRE